MIATSNPFKNIYRLAETLNNFACHHLQNNFYHENSWNQTLEVAVFYLALHLVTLLLLMLLPFIYIRVIYINPRISNLLPKLFSFIFLSSISPVFFIIKCDKVFSLNVS